MVTESGGTYLLVAVRHVEAGHGHACIHQSDNVGHLARGRSAQTKSS